MLDSQLIDDPRSRVMSGGRDVVRAGTVTKAMHGDSFVGADVSLTHGRTIARIDELILNHASFVGPVDRNVTHVTLIVRLLLIPSGDGF